MRLLCFPQTCWKYWNAQEHTDQISLISCAHFMENRAELCADRCDLDVELNGDLTHLFPRQQRRRNPALCR
jgi:hypothetical protein